MITTAGQSLLSMFDRVRIINLKARQDRRREITKQFAKLGLSIDGKKIAFHEACRPDDSGKFHSIGERGCFLSHLSILETALADNVENVLIIEDDLDFSNDIESRMPSALYELARQSNWGIFYGGYVGPSSSTNGLHLAASDIFIWTTHFLAFSRETIRLIVPRLLYMAEYPDEFSRDAWGQKGIDAAYIFLRKNYPEVKTWFVSPVLGHQRSSRTDVQRRPFYDETPVLRDLATFARRIIKRRIFRK